MTKKEIELAFKRWRADIAKDPEKFSSRRAVLRSSDYETLRYYSKSARWPQIKR